MVLLGLAHRLEVSTVEGVGCEPAVPALLPAFVCTGPAFVEIAVGWEGPCAPHADQVNAGASWAWGYGGGW